MTLHEFINNTVKVSKKEIKAQGIDPYKSYQDTTLGEIEKIAASIGSEFEELVTQ